MRIARRHVLQLLAASPLAACGGGDLPDPYAAWRDPGAGEADPRRFALAHAILAPNPHNTQPWLVELDDADGMTLYCDLERRLPFTDPFDRQITIGCGCFLELYAIALADRGFACEVTPFPEGAPELGARLDARPLAHVRRLDQRPDHSTFPVQNILWRRTNRETFSDRAVTGSEADELIAGAFSQSPRPAEGTDIVSAHYAVDEARVAALRDLVFRAWDLEMRTPGAVEETYSWLRFGREEIARHGDGLAIQGPMIPAFKAMGFLGLDDFLDPDSTANKQAADDWRAKANSAQGFIWLNSVDDAPATRLTAGRAYARLNLAAAGRSIGMHPWSQALQEYEEMAALYAEARELLGAGDETVQMLVRVGHAERPEPTARRGVAPILRA